MVVNIYVPNVGMPNSTKKKKKLLNIKKQIDPSTIIVCGFNTPLPPTGH
jgi:hypothetical protein